MKTAAAASSATIPETYAACCQMHLPRPIHTAEEYHETIAMAERFAVAGDALNAEQLDYYDILCALIEQWDRAHVKWPHVSPLRLLEHLLEERGWGGADLSRLLGASRQLGPMIIRGERALTVEHIRTLAKFFHLSPAAFV